MTYQAQKENVPHFSPRFPQLFVSSAQVMNSPNAEKTGPVEDLRQKSPAFRILVIIGISLLLKLFLIREVFSPRKNGILQIDLPLVFEYISGKLGQGRGQCRAEQVGANAYRNAHFPTSTWL